MENSRPWFGMRADLYVPWTIFSRSGHPNQDFALSECAPKIKPEEYRIGLRARITGMLKMKSRPQTSPGADFY